MENLILIREIYESEKDKKGGVEMAISLLADAFARRGYEVEILCIYNLGQPAYEISADVKITYLTCVAPNREEFLLERRKKNVAGMLRGAQGIKSALLKAQLYEEGNPEYKRRSRHIHKERALCAPVQIWEYRCA